MFTRIVVVSSLSGAEMSGAQYWRQPFLALVSPKHLIEYMVMDVELVSERDKPHRPRMSTKVSFWGNIYIYAFLSCKKK